MRMRLPIGCHCLTRPLLDIHSEDVHKLWLCTRQAPILVKRRSDVDYPQVSEYLEASRLVRDRSSLSYGLAHLHI